MPNSAVVVPTSSTGAPQPGGATAITPMTGGMLLSPLPLGGGKRKTKKVPKKILKLFKKGSAKKLRKLMKGGNEAVKEVTGDATESAPEEGAGRRKTRRGSRKSRRGHSFLY